MKNKLRAIANWIMVLTCPIWFLPVFAYLAIASIGSKDPDFEHVFLNGEQWWWQ